MTLILSLYSLIWQLRKTKKMNHSLCEPDLEAQELIEGALHEAAFTNLLR